MNLPNKLTVLRMLLTPIGLTILFVPAIPRNILVSLAFFLVAMATDVADGMIARTYRMITKFGTFLDPLADKLIILLHFAYLQSQGIYPLWLFMLMLGREIIIDAFRTFATRQNMYVNAVIMGKCKAFLQTLSITVGMVAFAAIAGQLSFSAETGALLGFTAYVLMIGALLCSLIGVPSLLRENLSVLKEPSASAP